MCLQSWVGGDGGGWGAAGEGGPGGAAPVPPLSLSLAHPSISAALLCCRDGAGLSPGAHFIGEDGETLCSLAGFDSAAALGGQQR